MRKLLPLIYFYSIYIEKTIFILKLLVYYNGIELNMKFWK